tara:strand:- start:330 stop:1484 length:1155 start_codon:yes stop_codon:yes gene_type:complete
MKIAFVPSTFLPLIGGAEIQAHNLANKLTEKNISVDLWNLENINIKNAKYKIYTLNKFIIDLVYLCKYYLHIDLSFILQIYIKGIIKEKAYDVWHFHSLNFKLLLIINVLKKNNQKVIVTLQGADTQIDKEIKYGYRLDKKYDQLFLSTIKKIDILHAISNEIKNILIKLNINENKICLIPNATNLEKIFSYSVKKDKEFTMITVARNATFKKGYDFVEDIAKILINRCEFKWKIIGRNVKKIAENNFIKKNINHFNFIDEISIDENNEKYYPANELISHYKSSNIYLHLSRIESFGITMTEALASDLPIIAFDTPGANEIVKNNLNGFLIKPYDMEIYCEKIIHYFNNRNKIKIDNREFINYYSLENTSMKFITIYKSFYINN